jgi:hypothetical protein
MIARQDARTPMIARAIRLLLASGFLAAVAHVAPVAESAALGSRALKTWRPRRLPAPWARFDRAHGTGPRRSAKQPWLAAGVSRSTWYMRRKRARDAAFVRASLDRAESFAAALTRDLARCAALERESMAIIEELTALAAGGIALRSAFEA